LDIKREKFYVLSGTGNLWWSGATNLGIKYSIENHSPDYIALWNNDITCSDNYFTQLGRILATSDEDSIVASKILSRENPKVIFSCGAYFNKYTGKKTVIGNGQLDGEEFMKTLSVDWCGGMGTFFPADLIKRIGYFDQISFPQYDGDTDYFLRAKNDGFTTRSYPGLLIFNNTDNTGKKIDYSFANYLWWMTDVKSFMNINTRFRLYAKHTVIPISIIYLFLKYLKFSILYFLKTIRLIF
jgi:GT2 family glycosyltransferase